MVTETRVNEVLAVAKAVGDERAMELFGIKEDTLRRYKDEYQGDEPQRSKLIDQLFAKFNENELRSMVKSGAITPGRVKVPPVEFTGDQVTFGLVTDTHFGSKYTPENMWLSALVEFRRQNVDFLVHCGDLSEGMSTRPGHIYECSHLGYEEQKAYATEMLAKWEDAPAYIIDGNHDRWFLKSAGAHIVKDCCDSLDNWNFLGHDTGCVPIAGGVVLELWHGEDGNSYAISYRLQKIVESLTGGTKPNVLVAGHTHKQGYFFERNIHVISAGAIQMQTPWMRGKRIASHTGFWVVRMVVDGPQVVSLTPTWYPFYR